MASQADACLNKGSTTSSDRQRDSFLRRLKQSRYRRLGSSTLPRASSAPNASTTWTGGPTAQSLKIPRPIPGAAQPSTPGAPRSSTPAILGPFTDVKRTIIFDLDAIIDPGAAKELAMKRIQQQYGLEHISVSTLLQTHKLQTEIYRGRYPSLDENAVENCITKRFMEIHGAERLTVKEVEMFRGDFERYQRKSLRPTAGTIETMVRLRETGWLIAVAASGSPQSREPLLRYFGIWGLIDAEFAARKPEDVFIRAKEWLAEAPGKLRCYVGHAKSEFRWENVADSPWMWPTLWYQPHVQSVPYIKAANGEITAPLITNMREILDRVRYKARSFEPTITYISESAMYVQDIGMDMVTRPRFNFHMSKANVEFVMWSIALMLEDVSEKRYAAAMTRLSDMMWRIAKIDNRIDPGKFNISHPGDAVIKAPNMQLREIERARHSVQEGETGDSVCIVYWYITFVDPETNDLVRKLALSGQNVCEALMSEEVDKALAWLQDMLFKVAAKGNCLADTHCELGIGNPLGH